ncbi:acyl-CoA thioesterase [Fervidibacillus halotolerans]|uniref:Acyl-CoA thioesterase n=1 Tax=Fervidibacillus halotolerans TaxID=2980027 RepID=A0A9E8M105_9BACI|nr:thioesterase family protein [Fervidibacillus halotolerans]WAA13465.1 acyl-CoA thioesterase [Fervidibacillus halotolerans]
MHISTVEAKVRYSETDQMGVVYHANYLVWMEMGRSELIEDLGFHYADMERMGILAPVYNVNVDYKKPCKYGEKVVIRTWIDYYNGVRIVYGYEIYNGVGELAATGTSSHVCVKKENFQPISVRKILPAWHEAYEKAKKK